jgi:NADPH:quinone reductase-like Zn-dependent oxidoreductase
MHAAVIEKFGPPQVLQLREVPVPELDPNEVLIAVHTAGVGVWDAKIRDGTWASGREKLPLVLGTDGSGRIAAVGSRVRRFQPGDEVWGYTYENPKGGFYAEYVAVAADGVAPVPPELNLKQAGAACVTGLTALQGIDDHLHVRRGETVMIVGASGAVGTLALQFADRKGAHVIGSASGLDAVQLVRRLGAHAVIDLRTGDADEDLSAAAPEGIDAILALAGGDPLERCLAHLKPGGRLSYPNGIEPEPRKRRSLQVIKYDAEASPRAFARLARAVAEARLRVPIAGQFPLEQAADAHAAIERGHVLGRIVLRVRR